MSDRVARERVSTLLFYGTLALLAYFIYLLFRPFLGPLAWAAILAVPTALAGIYGMNFKNMPELEMPYGYYAVIGVIVTSCAVLYWRFKRNGWL